MLVIVLSPALLRRASLPALPGTCCVISGRGATSLGISGGMVVSSFLGFEVICFQEPGRCICGETVTPRGRFISAGRGEVGQVRAGPWLGSRASGIFPSVSFKKPHLAVAHGTDRCLLAY